MRIQGGIEYIARLENNLSFTEINDRLKLLNDPKIVSSNNSVVECLRDPKVGIRDVYDKLVYDTVRRNDQRDSREIKPLYLGKFIY